MKKLSMLTGIMFLSIAVYAASVKGWDKATWGMSPEKIKALYQDSGIKDGEENTLVMPAVVYEGNTYDITFKFTNGKLSKVALFMGNANKSVFYALVDTYTKKYGTPDKKTDNEYVAGVVWGFSKTRTTVSFAYSRGFSGGNPTLQLNYELVK